MPKIRVYATRITGQKRVSNVNICAAVIAPWIMNKHRQHTMPWPALDYAGTQATTNGSQARANMYIYAFNH